jgi:hypothetical protein
MSLQKAKELLVAKRYDDARRILESMPDNITAQRWLAKLDEIAPVRSKRRSEKERDKLLLAKTYMQTRKYAKARPILESMPDDPTAQKWLADLDRIGPVGISRRVWTLVGGIAIIGVGLLVLITILNRSGQGSTPEDTARAYVNAIVSARDAQQAAGYYCAVEQSRALEEAQSSLEGLAFIEALGAERFDFSRITYTSFNVTETSASVTMGGTIRFLTPEGWTEEPAANLFADGATLDLIVEGNRWVICDDAPLQSLTPPPSATAAAEQAQTNPTLATVTDTPEGIVRAYMNAAFIAFDPALAASYYCDADRPTTQDSLAGYLASLTSLGLSEYDLSGVTYSVTESADSATVEIGGTYSALNQGQRSEDTVVGLLGGITVRSVYRIDGLWQICSQPPAP